MFNALIRTHHITSRKKVASLKRAAHAYRCSVLLCSGCPGIMYVEALAKDDVGKWVTAVRNLRYKDFQLVVKPACLQSESESGSEGEGAGGAGFPPGLVEVGSVKEFGGLMEKRGVWKWWRRGMGYG
ncbi:hypothetical protein ASPZODRAFT_74110 [Penicilliopsis zonata CBS 506.65]|uniref:Uncharacterized protein n=1 Tax=Penicilliopsis zonata CBS 506.65 TaxID=1073090 RepID=A0A1L9S948_9EURO|nr:hypothetical protein ASPZODRAFT_74110 [Penicilliopsis zonata CBS 506.65]OJJ43683.1 hypothetical protein ASPZODRAFT_74110 [Penicilliopsis zonata CBS 506.65]